MKQIISLCVLCVLLLFFISGCKDVDLSKVSKEDINKIIVCEPPYMRYASECCLDANNDSICDRDEGAIPPNPSATATKVSDENFGTGDIEIGKLKSGSKLTVPTTINVKQGEAVRANILVGNDGTCSSSTFTLSLDGVEGKTCNSAQNICAKIISKNTVDIPAGEEAAFVIGIVTTRNAPLSTGSMDTDKSVTVEVKCGSTPYSTSAFTINVLKGSEESNEQSDVQIYCNTNVDFKIMDVCTTGNTYKVTIQNNKATKLSFDVRFTDTDNDVLEARMFSNGISNYGISSESYNPPQFKPLKLVEVIPKVKSDYSDVTCSSQRQTISTIGTC